MRLLDGVSVEVLGTGVQDGESDQWKVVGDKRRRVPVTLEEDGPSAQLYRAIRQWRARRDMDSIRLTKQMMIQETAA